MQPESQNTPQPSLDLRPAKVKAGAMLDEQSRRERYRPLDCRDLVAGGVVHRVISAAGGVAATRKTIEEGDFLVALSYSGGATDCAWLPLPDVLAAISDAPSPITLQMRRGGPEPWELSRDGSGLSVDDMMRAAGTQYGRLMDEDQEDALRSAFAALKDEERRAAAGSAAALLQLLVGLVVGRRGRREACLASELVHGSGCSGRNPIGNSRARRETQSGSARVLRRGCVPGSGMFCPRRSLLPRSTTCLLGVRSARPSQDEGLLLAFAPLEAPGRSSPRRLLPVDRSLGPTPCRCAPVIHRRCAPDRRLQHRLVGSPGW